MGNPVLIWTNDNPTANFGAQKVYLDLSSYKAVGIKCRESEDTMFIFTKTSIDTTSTWKGCCGASYSGTGTRGRLINAITDEYIDFGNGTSNTSAASASSMQPTYIYGIS